MENLDEYYKNVVLPCKGFNLSYHMLDASPLHWDFAKIREELDLIEDLVRSIKQGRAA